MKPGRLIWLAILLLASFPQSLRADAIDDYVNAEIARQNVPGLTLMVMRDGQLVRAAGYGVANIEHDVPVHPDTLFKTGAVGMQFTAVGVMQLVDDGKVRLDDPIRKYFPEAPESWAPITVANLLNHTSGLPATPAGNFRTEYIEEEFGHRQFHRRRIAVPIGAGLCRVGRLFAGAEGADRAVVGCDLTPGPDRQRGHLSIFAGLVPGPRCRSGDTLSRRKMAGVPVLHGHVSRRPADPCRGRQRRGGDPAWIVGQVAAMLDPKYARTPGQPIADAEPQVTGRVRDLLQRIAQDRTAPEDFVDFATRDRNSLLARYRRQILSMGALGEVALFARQDRGDDRVYRYRARYDAGVVDVAVGLAPDGRIGNLDIDAVHDWAAPVME